MESKILTWEQLPDFGLYMEQILPLIGQQIRTWTDEEDVLTVSMVNNYAKKGVIPRPEHKKYYRRHIALLTVVAYLKNTMAISDISSLLGLFADDAETVYRIFYEALEKETETDVSGDDPKSLLQYAVQVNRRQLILKKKIRQILPAEQKSDKKEKTTEKKNGTQKK